MAGRSLAIYNGLADLCRVRLRDSESPYSGVKEASYCTLRSQLIMALHDNNISEITSKVRGPLHCSHLNGQVKVPDHPGLGLVTHNRLDNLSCFKSQ